MLQKGTTGCLRRCLLVSQSPQGSRWRGGLEAAEATVAWVGLHSQNQPHRQILSYGLNQEQNLLKAKKSKPTTGAGLLRASPLLSQVSSWGQLLGSAPVDFMGAR